MEFESKLKQSKSDVTNKNKQIKELEKEVESYFPALFIASCEHVHCYHHYVHLYNLHR